MKLEKVIEVYKKLDPIDHIYLLNRFGDNIGILTDEKFEEYPILKTLKVVDKRWHPAPGLHHELLVSANTRAHKFYDIGEKHIENLPPYFCTHAKCLSCGDWCPKEGEHFRFPDAEKECLWAEMEDQEFEDAYEEIPKILQSKHMAYVWICEDCFYYKFGRRP